MTVKTSIDKPIPLVADFQMREDLINQLKNRFHTYGYQQVRTSTFEDYDLYSAITGTVDKDDMLKVVDASGKVLVLRPDVTIPVSRMTALSRQPTGNPLRLFYVLDIFRQSLDQNGRKESTQAGIECFGQNTPETDAEVLMLAIHTLTDLNFQHCKIEIGHAGFFKELIAEAALNDSELDQLKTLIQSKNIAGVEAFLANLALSNDLCTAIKSIPLLYGNPSQVIERAEDIVLNDNMQQELDNLNQVITTLKAYGVEDAIVCNLGLINNMNYYSDIIFQGFTENVGKPVLMGGRYDHLGAQYNNPMAAIGFAIDVDFLKEVLDQRGSLAARETTPEITIYYDQEKQRKAFLAAYRLRDAGHQVLTFSSDTNGDADRMPSIMTIDYEAGKQTLTSNQQTRTFSHITELIERVQQAKVDG